MAVIEDNLAIRELLDSVLEAAGHHIIDIAPEREVMVKGAWEYVDVALIDLMLESEVSGLDFLKFLSERIPHVRRIVITAMADSVNKLPTEVADLAHAVHTKPFDLTALMAEVSFGRI